MLKKVFLLSVLGCLFMTASYGQYTLTINNTTCSPVDVFYYEGPVSLCTPTVFNSIPGLPATTVLGPIPLTIGMDLPVVRLRETGAVNGVHLDDPNCAGSNAATFPFVFGCDGLSKNAVLNFIPPFTYRVDIY